MLITSILAFFNLMPNYYTYVMTIVGYEVLFITVLSGQGRQRRKYYVLRMLFISLLTFGVTCLLGLFRTLNNSVGIQILCTSILYLTMLFIRYFLYKSSFFVCILDWCEALAIREIVDILYAFLLYFVNGDISSLLLPNQNMYLNGFIYDLVHCSTHTLLFFLIKWFNRNDKTPEKDIQIRPHIIVLSIVLLLIVVITKTMLLSYSDKTLTGSYMIAEILDMSFCVLILIIRIYIIRNSTYKKEIGILNQVLVAQQKQYESTKENIELINIKCHDIRHQLEHFQNSMVSEDVKRLSDAIKIYDMKFNTGNTVLDTVLYERSLRCEQLKITITCLADGKILNFISTSHLYYLLSNILDNAIEAVKKVKNNEERLIGINIHQENDDAIIEIYNYFEEEIKIENGNIKTSKEDTLHHGYGLKSIKLIAEEYKGCFTYHTEENMFFSRVIIPIKKQDK